MIDYLATIDPAAGLARRRVVNGPSPESPLWSVAIDLGPTWSRLNAPDGEDYPLLVGAYGLTMDDAFRRACGESVERAALVPAGLLWPHRPEVELAEPGDRLIDAGQLWSDQTDLGRIVAYRGRVVATGEPIRVPAPLVDFPSPTHDSFDPGPSGAASGPEIDAAQDSATRELLERDALMSHWYGNRVAFRIDLDAARDDCEDLDLLLDDVAVFDAEVVLAAIESRVPGAFAMMAFLIDHHRQVAACGMGFVSDPGRAMVKALVEAIQVRVLMLAGLAPDRPQPAGVEAHNDMERARLWASSLGVAAATRWSQALKQTWDPASSVPREQWRSLVPDLVWVDLSCRIPEQLHEMGWSTGKAIAPSLLPLRIDDSARCYPAEPSWVGLPHPII